MKKVFQFSLNDALYEVQYEGQLITRILEMPNENNSCNEVSLESLDEETQERIIEGVLNQEETI